MEEQRSSYRQIFKATSLFGGVQVFNILISIVKSKFIAVLLGPIGMGIAGLLSSTCDIINNLTSFGLETSAVRNIAAANASEDKYRLNIIATVVRRLVWVTGLLGALVMLALAPFLSELTFDSKDYTFAYIILSISLLFRQLTVTSKVLLQGMRKLKALAKASVLGSFLALVITIPLYYLFGLKGIVPSIICSILITFFTLYFYTLKIKPKPVTLSRSEIWSEGKSILAMGFMLSLSRILYTITCYLLKVYIGRTGNIADVGLYNAGDAIVISYTSLIFSAMLTDYYPRLSSVAHDKQLSKQTINQQAEIAILILAPMLTGLFVYVQWVVQLLYSKEFIVINEMIQWAALGIFLKAVEWSVGILFLAKGDFKLFFFFETSYCIYTFIFNILGYRWMGITGLGIASLAGYVVYSIQALIIGSYKYGFTFNRHFIKIFSLQFLCAIVCFAIVRYVPSPYHYIMGSCLIIASTVYSLVELNKRLALKEFILSKIMRKK